MKSNTPVLCYATIKLIFKDQSKILGIRMLQLLVSYFLTVNVLVAQDPHFSQFFANRVYLNPVHGISKTYCKF